MLSAWTCLDHMATSELITKVRGWWVLIDHLGHVLCPWSQVGELSALKLHGSPSGIYGCCKGGANAGEDDSLKCKSPKRVEGPGNREHLGGREHSSALKRRSWSKANMNWGGPRGQTWAGGEKLTPMRNALGMTF